MTDFENAYVGMGTSPHLDFDFKAIAGDKKTWSPTWGFVTKNWMSDLVMFKIGGSFGGFYYGVQGYGGDPDDKGNSGPQVNEYSDFAGVFGTGVYVTGVAGTSVNNCGVYGQHGEDPDSRIPQKMSAGVFGAAAELEPGVVGWSTKGIGGMGLSYSGRGVLGQSAMGGGVVGISDQSVGVQGYSGNSVGILGMTSNPRIPCWRVLWQRRHRWQSRSRRDKERRGAVPRWIATRALLHGESGPLVRGFR